MNHCVVPSNWDLEHNSTPPKFPVCAPSKSSNSLPSHVPSLEDYEVAELTWENGQLAMHGLGPPRVVNKSAAGAGTLESIVSQATCHPQQKPVGGGENSYEMVSCFEQRRRAMVNPAAAGPCIAVTADALVPCQRNIYDKTNIQENSVPPVLTGTGTCMVGSCSGAVAARDGRGAARRGMCGCRKNASVSESATCGGRGSRQVTVDTAGEREFGGAGFTSTSLWSPENTSSGGGDYAKTSGDEDLDHSVCHSRPQREAGGDVGKRKLGIEKSSVSTKRSRAAAVHNQSERKRRDKINQRMETLQKLVPNCSKTDKASMLDEVIEYLKQLQAQVHMVNRMNMPAASMMLPLALQQQLQMSMMGMGMGMGTVMDINSIGRAATAMQPVMPPASATGLPPATAFMPMPSWDVPTDRLSSPMVMPNDILSALMACQSQQQPAMTMDACSRLAALYQQFQQTPGPGYGSNN